MINFYPKQKAIANVIYSVTAFLPANQKVKHIKTQFDVCSLLTHTERLFTDMLPIQPSNQTPLARPVAISF